MRWKLLRRRLSIAAPRAIVRSHLPWPLRWAVAALVLGFSGAIALWAFEFGKDIAGLDSHSKEELVQLRQDVARLRTESEQAKSMANTADSLIKAERSTNEKLAQQVRQLEAEKQTLQQDLGFFERLLPAPGEGLNVRGLMAEAKAPGRLRYQMLVMQNGRSPPEFVGRYELTLSGQRDGKAWTQPLPGGAAALKLRQYTRLEGEIEYPPDAVVRSVLARVLDGHGAVRATQTIKL